MVLFCRRHVLLGLMACWAVGLGQGRPTLAAPGKVRVLIIDGQNNHNWRAMTPPMKADLESSGRFTVDVATTPAPKALRSDWDAFRPDFTTVMGHAMGDDTTAIRCIGFRTVMLRGAEWAATGQVTIPIPDDFPTASQVRLGGSGY